MGFPNSVPRKKTTVFAAKVHALTSMWKALTQRE